MPSDQVTNRGESAPATRSELDTFLADLKKRSGPSTRGRLIFALDATASRQPTWDTACTLQAEMFREAGATGGGDMQLRLSLGVCEWRSPRGGSPPVQLGGGGWEIMCESGHTQIEKVLIHAKKETTLLKVSALAFVGDAMEENPDDLAHQAGELGRLGVPVFTFQEGRDREVEHVFREIASLTHGACC